jgi:hypothetical protein
MAWASVPSPNPEFGGRAASQAELDEYDPDAWDAGYDLVFDAWDAQFEEDTRVDNGFEPASSEVRQRFDALFGDLNRLHEDLERSFENDAERREQWLARCKQSRLWRGANEG